MQLKRDRPQKLQHNAWNNVAHSVGPSYQDAAAEMQPERTVVAELPLAAEQSDLISGTTGEKQN